MSRIEGLVAAALTPLSKDLSVNLQLIEPMTQQLKQDGVSGLYICGSTGEGVSLTTQERMAVAEAYLKAADGLFTFVQVGHNSLQEAKSLAKHSASIGASAISATCPSYFKVDGVENLTDCMAEIAAVASDVPFYYYHIPSLTGSDISMPAFLAHARDKIPNLAGLKFTHEALYTFQECLSVDNGSFEVLWGKDEMLLPALSAGATAAIGSTYNIATPLYNKLIAAFEQGDVPAARELQKKSIDLVNVLLRFPFHAAVKATFGMRAARGGLEMDLGSCRLPLRSMEPSQFDELQRGLEELGYFEW